ncbi:pathogen-associated molecular patterns-induced protein A70-like [Rutidosis leptorrhynchoides]|uniref:pathogen-associated molecular patterns-induced protein A70-like n=1 Tax=Rutidosis leptorrhynchoides TaxID=125765 RepID=UPI003A9A05AA
MMIASIASWFTPTVIFCVTNLIIATIFIASNNNNNKQHDQNVHGDSMSRIGRVSSFLDRARSINLSSNYTPNTTTTSESLNHYASKPKTATYTSSSRLAQSIHVTPPSQLVPTPSLLERVKSIKLTSESSPGQLERVPSFFDRVKSFKISSPFTSPDTDTVSDPDPSHNNSDHNVIRSKSEKKSKVNNKLKSVDHQMKKSRSAMRLAKDDDVDVDLRRPATTRERRSNDVDEEVDAKADHFISKFKQQLKLQRLESLIRYNERLNRRY